MSAILICIGGSESGTISIAGNGGKRPFSTVGRILSCCRVDVSPDGPAGFGAVRERREGPEGTFKVGGVGEEVCAAVLFARGVGPDVGVLPDESSVNPLIDTGVFSLAKFPFTTVSVPSFETSRLLTDPSTLLKILGTTTTSIEPTELASPVIL